jgi:imidazolonepropionase
MADLNQIHFMDIVPTFLGAQAVPAEYKGKEDAYIDFIMDTVMPEVAERKLAEFCDIFCEQNVFSIGQSRRLLQKAIELGMKVKLHADEIVPLGGAELAAELGAVSADHLLQASDAGIHQMAQAGVVACLLPGTAFGLKEPYARGRYIIDSGCATALATDFNPGSCFSESIPLIFALATLYMDITMEEALTAVTLNGAAALGRADSIGSIDVGKMGDLIVLEFPSYKFIPYRLGISTVEKVIKKGNLVFDRAKGGIIYC